MPDSLRSGFTTGAAMTAGALALFLARKTGETPDSVSIRLPDSSLLDIPVTVENATSALMVKDAGDDPDVTDRARIHVQFRPASISEYSDMDWLEECGSATLILRGGKGVGKVTRPGLAVPVGKYAINPGPRTLLRKNLEKSGLSDGVWLLEISVEDGEEIAKKTLNPTLGIIGGISILGGNGIVKPHSHAAYIATIALQLRSMVSSGKELAVFVTGNQTEHSVLRDFPDLNPLQVVRIADFIADSIRFAVQAGIRHIQVCCMPGKLFKYACGDENTHAHKTKLRPELLREMGAALSPDLPLSAFDSMGELAAHLTNQEYSELLKMIHRRAEQQLSIWGGSALKITIVLYNTSGERIL